jgi:hypothetical protein
LSLLFSTIRSTILAGSFSRLDWVVFAGDTCRLVWPCLNLHSQPDKVACVTPSYLATLSKELDCKTSPIAFSLNSAV